MANVNGTTIMMTRGDTEHILIEITNLYDGEPYVPQEGDTLRFAVKKDYKDTNVLILKEIPIDTMTLTIEPEDTKKLQAGGSAGRYKYDIQLTQANGDVHTVIPRASLVILEEVE